MQASLFNYPVVTTILICLFMASSVSGQNLTDAAKAGNLADIKALIEKSADSNAKKNCSWATALSLAASEGHKDVVSFLIARKADVQSPAPDGYTPLMAAASQGWNDIVNQLIAGGADVKAKSDYGFTALMMAVWGGHAETIELLVQHGADINAAPYKGVCALMVAINAGNQRLVPILIRLGADPNPPREQRPLPPRLCIGSSEFGSTTVPSLKGHGEIFNLFFGNRYNLLFSVKSQTPLTAAASRGWREVVELLIANGADINVHNGVGSSAMLAASKSGNPELVKMFIEKGLDANGMDCQGNTPLSLASAVGDLESVKLLIDAGADLNPQKRVVPENWNIACPPTWWDRQIAPPLLAAASRGWRKVVELLIANGADINVHNSVGVSALLAASKSGNRELVKMFIEKGLNVNGMDCLGNTPLSLASASVDLELVKILINAGADLNPQKKAFSEAHKIDGICLRGLKSAQNPLRQAIANNLSNSVKIRDREELAIYLLKHGASIEPKEIGYQKSQEPFLTMALSNGMLNLSRYLIDKGANVNARCENDSLLYYFTTRNLYREDGSVSDTVRLLCENGADIDYRDRWGRTLLMVTARAGKLEVLNLLLTYGADVNALITSKTNHRSPGTALGFATDGGHLPAVEFLLEKGADVNKAAEKEATPLWFALFHKNIEIAQLLLDRGANMRSKCLDGMLVDFIGKKELELAMLMIDNGADLNTVNKLNNRTPLMVAILTDLPEMAAILINKGADVNATSAQGYTPLMIASQKGDLQTAKVLLQHNADTKIQAPDGYTAYIIAVNKGHQSIADLLKNNGGNTPAAIKYFATLKIIKKLSNEDENRDDELPSPAELNYYVSVLCSKLGIKDFLTWKPDPIFRSPEKTWGVYKKALSAYDLDLAIRCHAVDTQAKYKEIYSSLSPDKIKDIVKEMNPIERISGDKNSAKYRLKRKENKKMISYVVYFSNYFGEWKIEFY